MPIHGANHGMESYYLGFGQDLFCNGWGMLFSCNKRHNIAIAWVYLHASDRQDSETFLGGPNTITDLLSPASWTRAYTQNVFISIGNPPTLKYLGVEGDESAPLCHVLFLAKAAQPALRTVGKGVILPNTGHWTDVPFHSYCGNQSW